MAEEAVDYAAQEQARLDTYRRDRHAALLAAQRNAPAPANDGPGPRAANDGAPAPAPANDGAQDDDPEQYYRERTQARLAEQRSKKNSVSGGNFDVTSAFAAAGGSPDDIKDVILLGFAVAGFWAVWPPLALWASYHIRLVGGKRNGVRFFGLEIMTGMLGLLNEMCEQAVLPGAKAASKGVSGAAGQLASGGAGSPGFDTNAMGDLAGGDMSALNPAQLLLLIVADIIVAFGLLTCSAFVLTILAATGILVGACSALPSVCTTVLSAIRELFRTLTS